MAGSECSFNVAHGENEIDASRVKDGDRVICTGTWDKNGVLQATVISKLYTGICQRTRSISEAGDDLDYLSKKDVSSHGAGIEGTIEQLTRDSRYETRVIGFMAGISVLVQGPSGRWTTISRMDGFDYGGFSPTVIGSLLSCPRVFFPQLKL